MKTFFNNSSFSEQFHSANEQMNNTYKYTFHQHALKKFNLEDDSSLSTALKTQLLYAGMTNPEGMAVEDFDPTTLNDREFTQLYATLEDYQVYCENEKYTLEATAFRTLLAIQMNKKLESMNEEMKKVYSYTLYDHAKKNFNLEGDSSLSSTLKLQLVYAGMTNNDGTPNKEFDPSQLKKHEIIQLYTILADYQRSCEKDNYTDEAHAFGKLLNSIALQIAESQDKHQAIDLMRHICKVQKTMAPHSRVTDEIQEIQKSKGFKEGIDALSAIEELQLMNLFTVINDEHKKNRQNRFKIWIEKFLDSLTAESLNSLDKSHSYQLAALLVATESLFSDPLKLEQAVEALPNGVKHFYEHFKQLPKAGENKIIELNKIYKDSEDKYLVIASTINAFKIALKDVKNIEGIDLRDLGPYLTFADFRKFNDAEAEVKLLQNYHNLYFLFIKNDIIKSFPALPILQVLDCSECNQLINLPSQPPNLLVLDCSYCKKLTSLPNELPNVHVLDCYCCPALISMSNALPKLLALNCYECPRLTELSNELPNVQVLNCYGCNQLTSLPNELPNVQELNCYGCNQLTSLPNELPNVQMVNCYDCPRLTSLPNELPNLKKLTCSKCPALIRFPNLLPNVQQLNCSYCYQLTSLPSQLPNVQELNCSYCYQLTSFPNELPNVQQLDCSNCNRLERLPPLPNCIWLQCEDTPLREIPEVPAHCQVFTGRNRNITNQTWIVKASQLQNNPRDCLKELYENFLRQKKLFPQIRFQEASGEMSQGIDIGGLRRTLISTLFTSLLISKDFPQRFPREGIWPVLDENTNEIAYQAIGALLALCFRKNSFYKSGDIFALEVYAAMQVLAAKDDDECIQTWLARNDYPVDFFKLCSPNTIKNNISLAAIYRANDTFKNTVNFSDEAVINDEKIRAELRSKLLALIKEPINEVLNNTNIQKALKAIVNEMQEHLGQNERKEFLTRTSQDVKNSIEGQITAEAILSHLEFDRLGTETETWLRSWILERLGKEPESLRLFLIGITGNNGLSEEKIKIHLYEASIDPVKKCVQWAPTAHTCAYSIDIPSNYPNKELLFKKMDLFLEGAEGHGGRSGFDFG